MLVYLYRLGNWLFRREKCVLGTSIICITTKRDTSKVIILLPIRFLDKAAVDDGDRRAWSVRTVTQVEEAKIILRMLPIFLSSVLAYVPFSLLLSLTVQQGGAMDTRLCRRSS